MPTPRARQAHQFAERLDSADRYEAGRLAKEAASQYSSAGGLREEAALREQLPPGWRNREAGEPEA